MNENKPRELTSAPLGAVESHAPLLTTPSDGQLLYKIMSVENLLRSIEGNYIHFSRVDRYTDFPGADPHDGHQLPKDQHGNSIMRFEKAPDFSISDYYDQSRARTYASCFSLENSDFIWNNYANGSERGKVCVVFEFGKLRDMLNKTLQPGKAVLEYCGNQCHQIFSLNYGVIKYVDRGNHQEKTGCLPNPIIYTYLKDQQFSDEKELRISLSAFGMGQFALRDGSVMQFPPSLHLAFDFKSAITDGTTCQLLLAPGWNYDFLQTELHRLHIAPISR